MFIREQEIPQDTDTFRHDVCLAAMAELARVERLNPEPPYSGKFFCNWEDFVMLYTYGA